MTLKSCYGMSVAQLLEKADRSSPNKEIIYDGIRRMSIHDLHTEVNEVALGLSQIGIKPGDRVAVSLPIWYEFIVLVFAIAKIGAILVPFSTRYKEKEVEHVLQDSGTKAVFFTQQVDKVNQLDQLQSIKKRLKSLEYLIAVRFENEKMKSYQGLRELGRGRELPEVKLDVKEDVYALLYTSGTTGKPKGVMLTHNNLVDNVVTSLLILRATRDDVFLHAAPYFHIMGLVYILRLVACEGKAVLLETYKAEKALELMEQEKVTVHTGVPTLYALELNHPSFKSYDLSSLRLATMAGAPCPVEMIRRVKTEMGVQVLVSYGMTETSAMLTFTDFEDDDIIQAETVGRVVPGVEAKIVDDNRQDVAAGEVGELAVRSIGLMQGYYNLPDITRQAMDDERWFFTGDLATMDEKGYIRIVGRKKDMIIRGGYNIYPNELEEIFCTHPLVSDAAIVGLPDSVLGEVSCAAIVLKPECIATVLELKTFIKNQVADYKVPDHIVLMNALPKTASEKTQKFILKDIIMNEKMVNLR